MLPIIDNDRTEFGFQATQCGCPDCSVFCRYMPGYMIPADLKRMHEAVAPQMELAEFAHAYLLASTGATVMIQGKICQIPTLVPARNPDHSCVFLKAGRCSIHAVAPFGCRFFDGHMTRQEGDARCGPGLFSILQDNATRGDYHKTWKQLNEAGRLAPSARDSKAAMAAAEQAKESQ